MATTLDGRGVSAISFGIFGGPHDDTHPAGGVICAIFVDDKFEKFIRWPHRPKKPMAIGDFSWLIEALDAPEVSVADLQKIDPKPPPAREHVDPGLTVVFLALSPARWARDQHDLAKNARLRDQFNAARPQARNDRGRGGIAVSRQAARSGEVCRWLVQGLRQ